MKSNPQQNHKSGFKGSETAETIPFPRIPLINEETLLGIKELDEDGDELLNALLEMFSSDTPPRLEALKEALSIGNSVESASIAHSLKSGSLSMGAQLFASLCADIEQQARRGDLGPSRALFPRLAPVFAQTCRELNRRVKGIND
jgi:HPt (histidine-containing phosphotransfer) domain-containing protein